jgi:hypothetical protein
MIEPETSAVMDSLVRPLLASESRELDRRATKAAEWAVQAGVPGSGLAFFKRIAAYFDHYKELAGAVWAAMLRVLDETDIRSCPDLAGDLKQKFDSYMSAPAQRTRSSMVAFGQMGHAMPKETFDTIFEETRTKFHNEIELRCRRARGGSEGTQIRIGELKMGDSYTASQVGAMGPGAHAHDADAPCRQRRSVLSWHLRCMTIECPHLDQRLPATHDAITSTIRLLRSKTQDTFAILSESDRMTYMQTLLTPDGFSLDYQDGSLFEHYRTKRSDLSAEEIIEAFCDYSDGKSTMRSRSDGATVEAGRESHTILTPKVVTWTG